MYYKLEVDYFVNPKPYETEVTGWSDELDEDDFSLGKIVDYDVDKKLEFDLVEYEDGAVGLPDMFKDEYLIMSDRLVDIFKKAGVDNFQLFPAILKDEKRNVTLNNYMVVNIIGLIRAADMEKSEYIDMGGTGQIAVGFRNLVIDESQTGGALIFRMAESISTIIIHESIKKILDASEIKYLRYIPCIKDEDVISNRVSQ